MNREQSSEQVVLVLLHRVKSSQQTPELIIAVSVEWKLYLTGFRFFVVNWINTIIKVFVSVQLSQGWPNFFWLLGHIQKNIWSPRPNNSKCVVFNQLHCKNICVCRPENPTCHRKCIFYQNNYATLLNNLTLQSFIGVPTYYNMYFLYLLLFKIW